MNMAITLEAIHRDIEQVKGELHRLRSMLADESELTEEAREELKRAKEEMKLIGLTKEGKKALVP